MSVLGHLHEFCVYMERATNHFKNGSALPDIFFLQGMSSFGRYFNKNNSWSFYGIPKLWALL